MSWAAVGVAVVGAAGSYMSAREANKPRTGSGSVNVTTDRSPGLGSDAYRTAAMRRAYELMGGEYSDPVSAENTRFGVGRAAAPTGRMTGFGGTAAPAPAGGGGVGGGARRGRAGGGGGGGNRNNGVISAGTQAAIDALGRRAGEGSPYYRPAQDATTNLLAGNDPNAYRSQTFDRLSNLRDPDLERFKQMLFAGEMPGSPGVGGGGGGYGGGGSWGGGGGGPEAAPPVGVARDIRAVLDGKFLNEGNPYTDKLVSDATGDITRAYADRVIPGVNNAFQGAGRYGSGAYADALSKSAGEYTRELGSAANELRAGDWNSRMADYMQAMGYGTSLDQNAADNATSRANAAGAAGASAYGADRAAQSQMALARMGALQDAIGQGIDLSQFGLGGMAGLSSDYSRDYMSALGMVPDLSGMDIRDLSAASGANLQADQIRMTDRASARSAGTARQALNFDRQRWEHDLPFGDLARYMDIINSASGPYGSEHQYGTNTSTSPGAGVSPWGQAVAGGIAGYYAGQSYSRPIAGGGTNYYTQAGSQLDAASQPPNSGGYSWLYGNG